MKTSFYVIFVFLVVIQQDTASQTFRRTTMPHSFPMGVAAVADALPAGSYNVGTGQYFETLDDAFIRLSNGGILGPVILLLTDTLYEASSFNNGSFRLVGPIAGAGRSSRITIRPVDNVAVTIRGNGESVLAFRNVSYLSLDGVSLEGNTRLTVHALYNTQGPQWNDAIDFIGDCDFNVVQNLTARSDDVLRWSGAIYIYPPIGELTAPDSCLVSGVSVTGGRIGIGIEGSSPDLRASGNIIRGCHVGSPSDSLIAWGIHGLFVDGAIIEGNLVENLRLNWGGGIGSLQYQLAINMYGSSNSSIRSNVVRELCIKADNSECCGILASGGSAKRGNNVRIYNNMVHDLNTRAVTGSGIDGIRAWQQDSVMVEYNSVYLPESGDVSPTFGSAAAWFSASNSFVSLRNNVLVNMRDDSPYVSTAIGLNPLTAVSDYNDLCVGSFDSACVNRWDGVSYRSLADWQSWGHDAHSVSEVPLFRPPDLHIDTTFASGLDGRGTPLTGIITDFDGVMRNESTPDIGADEFDIVVAVDGSHPTPPTAFRLGQNYPNPFNPSTIIHYQLSMDNYVSLVVYDLLGREVAVLVNEEKPAGSYSVTFDASGLSSGVYLYRLSAGEFVRTRKMVLVR
jgi:hypothetical protein